SDELAITCSSTRHISTSCFCDILARSSARKKGQPYLLYQITRHPVSSVAATTSDSGNSSLSSVSDRPSCTNNSFACSSRTAHHVMAKPMLSSSYSDAERPVAQSPRFLAVGCSGRVGRFRCQEASPLSLLCWSCQKRGLPRCQPLIIKSVPSTP